MKPKIAVYGFHTYHALLEGKRKTICGRDIKNMEFQGTDLEDVECKRCIKLLKEMSIV